MSRFVGIGRCTFFASGFGRMFFELYNLRNGKQRKQKHNVTDEIINQPVFEESARFLLETAPLEKKIKTRAY